MWTREAAQVLRWRAIGSLEPGHHADLCIVDRDPLRCPLDQLLGTRVFATVLAGRVVHGTLSKPASAPKDHTAGEPRLRRSAA